MITRYVNTGSTAGGDGTTNATTGANRAFASLKEACDAFNSTSTSDNLEFLCCGSVADTQMAWIDASMLHESYTLYVKANPNDAAGFHGGKWNDSSYRVVVALDGENAAFKGSNAQYNVVIDGIQLRNNGLSSGGRVVYVSKGTGKTLTVKRCLVVSNHSSIYHLIDSVGSGSNLRIENSVLVALTQPQGHAVDIFGASAQVYNTITVGCDRGLFKGSGSATAKNCISFNNSSWDIYGFNTVDHCATDDGTGTNPISVPSWAAQFSNPSYVADIDFTPVQSSVLFGAGVGPSVDSDVPTTDIIGNTRSGATASVGVYETADLSVSATPSSVGAEWIISNPSVLSYFNEFSASLNLQFLGNTVVFDASSLSAMCPLWYVWDFGEGDTVIYSSATTSATHTYLNTGIFCPSVTIIGPSVCGGDCYCGSTIGSVSGTECAYRTFSASCITINPTPSPSFSGSPLVNNELFFFDANGAYYAEGTIISAVWDFGDGSISALPHSSPVDMTQTIPHSYSSPSAYTVTLSAVDVSGTLSTGSFTMGVIQSEPCKLESLLITTCGPHDIGRVGNQRLLNLVDYLPHELRDTETEQFLQMFEDYLNEMFGDLGGFTQSGDALTVSGGYVADDDGTWDRLNKYTFQNSATSSDANMVSAVDIQWPLNSSAADSRISILEKIHRLTDLHDPDLIDIEYIQFFAKNLGYNVNVTRTQVGLENLGIDPDSSSATGCSAIDQDRYLRFLVSNLPTWYKIKTTNNAVKVMLYSFGLVGELIEYFTDSYNTTPDGGRWRLDYDRDLAQIPEYFYPTPHFAVVINIDSSRNISFDVGRTQSIINAIESIRPVNTVFRRLSGYLKRIFDIRVSVVTRMTRYMRIRSDGYSNNWFIS